MNPRLEEVRDSGTGLVGPQAIELFPEHIRFEQATVRREQRLQLRAL